MLAIYQYKSIQEQDNNNAHQTMTYRGMQVLYAIRTTNKL